MPEGGVGDYFIRDTDDDTPENEQVGVPVVVPQPGIVTPQATFPAAVQPQPAPVVAAPAVPVPPATVAPVQAAPQVAQPAPQAAPPVPEPRQPQMAPQPAPQFAAPTAAPFAPAQEAAPVERQREDLLERALKVFMTASPDVEAAALVTLDGFIIASALPQGMQEDRVGAMSAAILGLGERAAAELGRGSLSQVFIEGDDGYVVLLAAGGRAVLTVLAAKDAKLGLVLYDMKTTAARIGDILR